MSFELKIALKYLRARRKTLVRFTSIAAIAGIAAGVASLILAQALARGFADEIEDKILANSPHISVSMNDGSEIYDWKLIKDQLGAFENVTVVSGMRLESAVIAGKKVTGYGVIRAVEKIGSSSARNGISQSVGEEPIGVSLGAELAAKLGLNKGDEAEIITAQNDSARSSKVLVLETFQTGLFEYDSTWINVSPEAYLRLSGKERFTPTLMTVAVNKIFETDKTAADIRQKLGGNFKVLDWQEANQPLFAALSLERKVSLAIISLIIFIASLNITTTLSLLVNERKLDIAVLRTCGAKTKSLLAAFLIEGTILGSIGIVLGLIIGISGCILGNYFRIVNLPHEVYSLSFVPFRIDFINVLLIVLIAFVICSAATLYPALKASRVKPLENLRFH